MVYEIHQCFAYLATCFEKTDWYHKNDGTLNPISTQIYLFDDWINKSYTKASNADQDSSDDVPTKRRKQLSKLRVQWGKVN